jgi:hypothetical protein
MEGEFTKRQAELILRGTNEEWEIYILRRRCRIPYLEPHIVQFPGAACVYAINAIGGRWPEAELIIAKDPWAAYSYAHDIIRGRWPQGERAIDKNPEAKRWYDSFLKRIGQGR